MLLDTHDRVLMKPYRHFSITCISNKFSDQVNYLLEDDEGRNLISSNRPPMVFFTEEGGKRAGVHARDSENGRYLTIVESLGDWAETTGLAFSPDYRHMYFAFQEEGLLFDVSRDDGYAFDANVL